MGRALAFLVLLGGLATAGTAYACACCAEPGTWYQTNARLRPDERAELTKLRFKSARRMASGAEGRFAPVPLKAKLSGHTWLWQLDQNGATLTLHVPAVATTLAADLHDGKQGGGGGPLLYKELRLAGTMSSKSTILQGTRYRLVLQGRGNNCLNAADYRSWHLDILGGKRTYSLYGTFR
jgi:hypothetical protein